MPDPQQVQPMTDDQVNVMLNFLGQVIKQEQLDPSLFTQAVIPPIKEQNDR